MTRKDVLVAHILKARQDLGDFTEMHSPVQAGDGKDISGKTVREIGGLLYRETIADLEAILRKVRVRQAAEAGSFEASAAAIEDPPDTRFKPKPQGAI